MRSLWVCLVLGLGVMLAPLHGGADAADQDSGHGAHADSSDNRTVLEQDALTPFVDPLPIPPRAEPVGEHEGAPLYEVTLRQVEQKLHRDLPPTPVFTYNGIWPGPTFNVQHDQPVHVRWRNALPEHYPDWLPVNLSHHVPDDRIRTVTHLHGGITKSRSDGYPTWTQDPGEEVLYHYTNGDAQGDGAMLWYHDHAMGNTRLNVYAGLAGFYLLRNPEKEAALNLPSGAYEIPLVLQDRNFAEDGTLVYPGVCRNFGVVNGAVFPYLEVEPRRYRFRVLNGSNFRIKRLALSNGASFSVIGGDDGLLTRTVETDELLLAPAERADIIVDFSDMAGAEIVLENTTSCFGPQRDGQQRMGDVELPHLMQFRVAETADSPDESAIPQHPVAEDRELERILAEKTVERAVTLDEHEDFLFLINDRHFDAPVEIRPRLGDSEVWNIVNLTDEAHPFHIHLISFRIIERVPFREGGVEAYIRDRDAGQLKDLDSYLIPSQAEAPAPQETGPKDVALAPFGYVTRLAVRWYGFPGRYVIHCHLLDHEDNDMMRPIEVLPAEASDNAQTAN
ncbi:multicopper oxidase family protein [Fodinicurvata fenggangensis]|uniref:multicopper oxidase family protein n=1 Tax=Fodinicurvata fenggangensis TaxID=1121830 RepID=UPI0006893D8A|nr:multicopper oxidase family protein [Fodinicurvata fenggangensis]